MRRVATCDDRLLRADGFEKLAQAVVDRRRSDESQRLGCAAERLVETLQKLGRKACCKGRARLVDQRADALEAEPPQRRACVGGKAQRLDRQGRKGRGFLPGGESNGRGRMKARKGPGCPRRIGNGEPCWQAEVIEPTRKIGEQLSSPPKRWAAPVTSRKKPSAPFSSPQGETAGE